MGKAGRRKSDDTLVIQGANSAPSLIGITPTSEAQDQMRGTLIVIRCRNCQCWTTGHASSESVSDIFKFKSKTSLFTETSLSSISSFANVDDPASDENKSVHVHDAKSNEIDTSKFCLYIT